jgi:hypothetical protein
MCAFFLTFSYALLIFALRFFSCALLLFWVLGEVFLEMKSGNGIGAAHAASERDLYFTLDFIWRGGTFERQQAAMKTLGKKYFWGKGG